MYEWELWDRISHWSETHHSLGCRLARGSQRSRRPVSTSTVLELHLHAITLDFLKMWFQWRLNSASHACKACHSFIVSGCERSVQLAESETLWRYKTQKYFLCTQFADLWHYFIGQQWKWVTFPVSHAGHVSYTALLLLFTNSTRCNSLEKFHKGWRLTQCKHSEVISVGCTVGPSVSLFPLCTRSFGASFLPTFCD